MLTKEDMEVLETLLDEKISGLKDDDVNKSEKGLKDEFTEIEKSLQEISEILARIETKMGIENKSIREN